MTNQAQGAPDIVNNNEMGSQNGAPSWANPRELTGPPAFKKRLKPLRQAYDLSGYCEAPEKETRRGGENSRF
jgi:hypothetical protein